jgi:carboxylesterase
MPLMPGAQSFSQVGDDLGIVVLHGFTGSPAAVRPWAQYLADAGHTVSAPRLPGHGTRWQDLNSTTWTDWYTEAERAVAWLRRHTKSVVAMGISTGATLALRLAQKNSDVKGVVGVNPIIQTERRDRRYLTSLFAVMGSLPNVNDDIKRPGVSESAYDRVPLRAAHSLTQLWAVTKSEIGKVRVPVLIYRSADDHVAEPSNTVWLMANLAGDRQEVLLQNSFHVATLDYDAPTIFAGSEEFAQRVSRA